MQSKVRKLVIELDYETFLEIINRSDTARMKKRWLDAVALVNTQYVTIIREEIAEGLLTLDE